MKQGYWPDMARGPRDFHAQERHVYLWSIGLGTKSKLEENTKCQVLSIWGEKIGSAYRFCDKPLFKICPTKAAIL